MAVLGQRFLRQGALSAAGVALLIGSCSSPPVGEDAPLSVEGVESGTLRQWEPWTAATADFDLDVGREDEPFALSLVACDEHQPGVASYTFDLEEEDFDYPLELFVAVGSSPSDFGIDVSAGIATVDGPGRFTIAVREAEYSRLFRELGFDENDQYDSIRLTLSDSSAARPGGLRPSIGEGFGCWAVAGAPDGRVATQLFATFGIAPARLLTTAPAGTLQRLAQATGDVDEPLGMLTGMYGVGLDLFAEMVFITDAAGSLDQFTESIDSSNGCLHLQWTYERATVRQELRCPATDRREGEYSAGGLHFGFIRSGEWHIYIEAADKTSREAVIDSLQTLRNIETRPEPYWMLPGGQVLASTPTREGELVAILVRGAHRACGDCKPGPWVHVYEIVDMVPRDVAAYPFPGCLVVVEESLTFAVGRDNAMLLVDGAEVKGFGHRAPAVLSQEDDVGVVTLVNGRGDKPVCLSEFESDESGVLGPFSDPQPQRRQIDAIDRVAGDRCEIPVKPVRDSAKYRDAYSDPALCAEDPAGPVTVTRHVRSIKSDETTEICVTVYRRAGHWLPACGPEGEFGDSVYRHNGHGWESLALLAPANSDEVVVVTTHGDEIRGPAVNGIGYLYWSSTQGQLRAVFAIVDGDLVEIARHE